MSDLASNVWAAFGTVDPDNFLRGFQMPDVPAVRRGRKAVMIPGSLLTMTQAAARLSATPEQLKKFIDDGSLRYVNIGRGSTRPRYRFTDADLDGFIESRKQEHQPCPSTSKKGNTISAFSSKVIGFTERRTARLSARPKSSKP